MPARKRKLRKKRNENSGLKLASLAVLLILILGLGLFWSLRSGIWDKNEKLSIVVNQESSVKIITLDPRVGEITNINIPGNTQVEVAHQLGTWRLKSVWQLGEDEGLEGRLLAKTVTKYFKFPVYAWSSEGVSRLVSGNPVNVLKSLFTPVSTNLTFGDRLRIATFSMGVFNTGRVDVDLVDTPHLKKTRLVDGEEGYVVVREPSQRILSVFADSTISKGGFRVFIKDQTSVPGLAEEVGKILEVLGAKVASIEKSEGESVEHCLVLGEEKTAERVARYFGCDVSESELGEDFDLEIVLGKSFIEGF